MTGLTPQNQEIANAVGLVPTNGVAVLSLELLARMLDLARKQALSPPFTQEQDMRDDRQTNVEAQCADGGPNSPRSHRFRRKQLVRHVKTGGVYRIVHTPEVCRIEAMNEPAYAYRMVGVGPFGPGLVVDIADAPLWVRPQTEMEDGRFEPV